MARLEAERLEQERLVKVAKKENLQQQIKLKEKELDETIRSKWWYIKWESEVRWNSYQDWLKNQIKELKKQEMELGV